MFRVHNMFFNRTMLFSTDISDNIEAFSLFLPFFCVFCYFSNLRSSPPEMDYFMIGIASRNVYQLKKRKFRSRDGFWAKFVHLQEPGQTAIIASTNERCIFVTKSEVSVFFAFLQHYLAQKILFLRIFFVFMQFFCIFWHWHDFRKNSKKSIILQVISSEID